MKAGPTEMSEKSQPDISLRDDIDPDAALVAHQATHEPDPATDEASATSDPAITDIEKLLEISPLLTDSMDKARRWVFLICGPTLFLSMNDISPSIWPGVSIVFNGWSDALIWRLVFTLNTITALVYATFFLEHFFSLSQPYDEYVAYRIQKDGSIGSRVFQRKIRAKRRISMNSPDFLIRKTEFRPTRRIPRLMVAFRRVVFRHLAPICTAAAAVWNTLKIVF